MSFQLSQDSGQPNIFFIHKKDVSERFDPLFHVAVQKINADIVKKAKFSCELLINTCSISRGRFGHRPRNDPRFYGGEHPFIQTGDIVKASNNNASIEYTQTLNDMGLKTSKLFQPPKLLFTIAANIGDTAILDFPSCFPDSIVAVIPKSDEVSLHYLNYYLKLIKPYVVDLAPYSAQKNLNNQQLAQVPIVIPPKEVQAEIVAKMDAAYAAKKQKEAEAQALLDSIDDYLLGELGITLPAQQENTLANRIFTRPLSEVSGGRFDPKLYGNKTVSLKKSIQTSFFPRCKLKKLIVESVAGDWGKELCDHTDGFSKSLVIRATEFDNLFNLNLNNKRLKYRLISHNKLIKINVNENDLLIEKSGGSPDQPVGRVAIITAEILNKASTIGFSNFIQKIRLDKHRILPSYLFCFLKTIYSIGLTDAMQSQTNGIRNLIMGNYYDQYIPLPPLEKQEEINSHITQNRKQAKQLQQEAKAGLAQAKKEVEAMILGEGE